MGPRRRKRGEGQRAALWVRDNELDYPGVQPPRRSAEPLGGEKAGVAPDGNPGSSLDKGDRKSGCRADRDDCRCGRSFRRCASQGYTRSEARQVSRKSSFPLTQVASTQTFYCFFGINTADAERPSSPTKDLGYRGVQLISDGFIVTPKEAEHLGLW